MPFKVAALVLPLSLDSFAVSAALGVAGLSRVERIRLGIIMATFEALMPLVGLAAGSLVGRAVAGAADYVAVLVLLVAGGVMLREKEGEPPTDLARRRRGVAALGLGLSVSLDELAIGFTIGLLGLPVLLVVTLIAAQAFLASQAGSSLGRRVGERLRERAEQIAGLVLIGLALVLLGLRLAGHAA